MGRAGGRCGSGYGAVELEEVEVQLGKNAERYFSYRGGVRSGRGA